MLHAVESAVRGACLYTLYDQVNIVFLENYLEIIDSCILILGI